MTTLIIYDSAAAKLIEKIKSQYYFKKVSPIN